VEPIHAHFHLEMSNVCNFCCLKREPSAIYVSRQGTVRAWNERLGNGDVAIESYGRMRNLVRSRLIDLKIDVDEGMRYIDSIVTTPSHSPIQLENLKIIARAIETLREHKL